jgi:hypothetical protein
MSSFSTNHELSHRTARPRILLGNQAELSFHKQLGRSPLQLVTKPCIKRCREVPAYLMEDDCEDEDRAVTSHHDAKEIRRAERLL